MPWGSCAAGAEGAVPRTRGGGGGEPRYPPPPPPVGRVWGEALAFGGPSLTLKGPASGSQTPVPVPLGAPTVTAQGTRRRPRPCPRPLLRRRPLCSAHRGEPPAPRPQPTGRTTRSPEQGREQKGRGRRRGTDNSPSGPATGALPSLGGPEAESWTFVQLPRLLWKLRFPNGRRGARARSPPHPVTSGPPTTGGGGTEAALAARTPAAPRPASRPHLLLRLLPESRVRTRPRCPGRGPRGGRVPPGGSHRPQGASRCSRTWLPLSARRPASARAWPRLCVPASLLPGCWARGARCLSRLESEGGAGEPGPP